MSSYRETVGNNRPETDDMAERRRRYESTQAQNALYRSGEIDSLMPVVAKAIGAVKKAGWNAYDKYKFRSIADVYQALHPALFGSGVWPHVQTPLMEQSEHPTQKGGTQFKTVVLLRIVFRCADGSFVGHEAYGEGMDRGDKSLNKAYSSAVKNLAQIAFMIPDEDPVESENDSPEVKAAPKQRVTEKQRLQDEARATFANFWPKSGGMRDAALMELFGENVSPKVAIAEATTKELKEYIKRMHGLYEEQTSPAALADDEAL